jgi:putative hemolysin
MDSDILPQLLLILLLTLINAFFASAELAIVSVNRNKIKLMAENGNKKAKLIEQLNQESTKFLSTIQVGITLAGFFSSASAATGIADDFGAVLRQIHIPYANQIALILITILLSYITLVFGELFPKRLALLNPEKVALFCVKPILAMQVVATPFIALLTKSVHVLMKLTRTDKKQKDSGITTQEFISMVDEAKVDGAIDENESNFIRMVLDFSRLTAQDILTPRVDVAAVEEHTPYQTVQDIFQKTEFSRLPVYQGSIDHIIGFIHQKDFYTLSPSDSIQTIMKPVLYTPGSTRAATLLQRMQTQQIHCCVVTDEYGGTLGIVTMEDILEELVGEIWDEHDESIHEIQKLSDGAYRLSGKADAKDLFDLFSLSGSPTGTISGLILEHLDRIPAQGESFHYQDIILEITKVSDHRILEVKAYKQNNE